MDSNASLGVGITFSSAVIPLLETSPELIDLIEFEPQTAWLETGKKNHPYEVSLPILNKVTAFSKKILVHGIGTPVGGTVKPDPIQLNLLKQIIHRLDPPWFSDHLSFNQTGKFRTGFFLPPRQTFAGIEASARSIRLLQSTLEKPIAVETGVNYFQPRSDEMSDGEFVSLVATEANCGILLDLHNIYANQLNGRQHIDDFLTELPAELVWELHIAGGFEMDGYWLDAHSGPIPDVLLQIAYEVVPSLENLRAIVFEIYPSFVEAVGLDRLRQQMEHIRHLWNSRQREKTLPGDVLSTVVNIRSPKHRHFVRSQNGITPEIWEETIGSLVTGATAPENELAFELVNDPGIKLVQRLINEFRASMIVRALPYTSRLLMLSLGPSVFQAFLQEFWDHHTPYQFAITEARAFVKFLQETKLAVPHIQKIIEYENAIISTLVDKKDRIVSFDFDPFPLLRSLAKGQLPEQPLQNGLFEIELVGEATEGGDGVDSPKLNGSTPFH